MATPFKLKRSAVPSKRPSIADLKIGELAINFYDGYLYAAKDTANIGIANTVSLLTPWTENFGGSSIYYNNSVGIGTTNPNYGVDVNTNFRIQGSNSVGIRTTPKSEYALDLVGNTRFTGGLYYVGVTTFIGDVSLNNNLKVTGVSSFTSDSMFSNNLFVAGITTTGNFRVTGVSTLTGDTNLTNNLNVLGITTTGNFRVTGVSTLTGDTNFTNNVNVGGITTTSTFRVTGISTLTGDVELTNNLRVSGIGTINNLRVTGVSTLTGDTNFTNNVNVSGITTTGNFRVIGLSTLSGNVNLTNHLNVLGITTTGNFRVTGVSTLTGDTNFTNNINVSGITTTGNFRVTGISTFPNVQIGFGNTDLIVSGDARVTGILTVGTSSITLKGTTDEVFVGANTRIHTAGYDIGSSFIHSTGVETVNAILSGIATFTSTENNIVQTAGTAALNNITVAGVSTFTGVLYASTVIVTGGGINTFAYLDVTNNARINNLYNNIGVVTTLSGENLYYSSGIVTALTSTNANVTGIITAVDVNVSSAATITRINSSNIQIGVGTFNKFISTDSYTSGIGSVTTLYVNTGITTQATITNANVTGIITAVDVNVSSAATINTAKISTATINSLIISNDITSNTGIFTGVITKYLTVTNTSTIIVSAASTLGVGTDRVGINTTGIQFGDLIQSSSGDIPSGASVVTILTNAVIFTPSSTNIFETNPTITISRSNNVGIASISTLFVNSGIATQFNSTESVIGVATATRLVSSGVLVSGITTTSTLYSNIGIITSFTTGDAYHTGITTTNNFYAQVGLITTLSGTNINYSGIGSISNFNANVGIITTLSGNDIFYSGIGTVNTLNSTTASLTTLSGNKLTYTNADITYGYISGVGTADTLYSNVGFVTFISGQNLRYTGIGTIQNLYGLGIGYTSANLEYIININNVTSGISTVETLRVNSGIVTTLSGTRATYTQADLTNTYTSGISSISDLRAAVGVVTFVSGTNLNYSGVGTITFLSGTNLSYTGIGTIETLRTNVGFVTTLSGTNVSYSGIGTVETLRTNIGFVTTLSGTNVSYNGIGTIASFNSQSINNAGFTTTSSLHVGVGGSLISVVSGIGSVGIGTTNAREKLHVYGNIMHSDNANSGTARVAVTTTTSITIHETLSRLEYRSVEYQIQASTSGIGATGRYQFTKILSVHNGTTSYNVEYATVGTGTDVASYEVDIDAGLDAGYIRLRATPAQVGITTFVINFVGFRI